MTGEHSLYARAALGAVFAAAGAALLTVRRFRQGSSRTFDRLAILGLIGSRAGIYLLVFFNFGIAPRGDIPAYYYPQALQALHGSIPYLSLFTSYAPLHPYLDAAAIYFWRTPLAIILLAICAEAFLLPVWLSFARALFSEQHVRIATLLYIASPISIQFVAIDGQDDVLIALLLALATYACYRHRSFLSGSLIGLSVVLVKFLPLLFAPVFVLAAPRRMRSLAGLCSVLVLGYGGFALMHASILYPLRAEGSLKTASNLPYLFESVSGLSLNGRMEDAVTALALLAVLIAIMRRLRGAGTRESLRILTFGPAALMLTLMLFSKKSWPPYLMFALFPLCLLFHEQIWIKLRLGAFILFSLVAIVVQSVWATVFRLCSAGELHQLLFEKDPTAMVFLAMELALIGGYMWLLAESMRQVISARELSGDEPAVAETGPATGALV